MTNEPSAPRRRFSKGVIIRLAIYLPLLGFFGWRAADKAMAEREAVDDVFRQDIARLLESPPGMIDLSKMIPIDAQAELSAPAGFKPADAAGTTTGAVETGTTTGEAELDATGTTTSTTSTTTGEPLEPAAPEPTGTSTGTTTSTGP
jgi:hypothetical protein